jgi:hypothetical protein
MPLLPFLARYPRPSPLSLFLGGMCAVPPCCALHHLVSLSACASCIHATPPLPFRPNPHSTSLPTHHQPLWRCPSGADGGGGGGGAAAAVMGCWRSSMAMLLALAAELLLLLLSATTAAAAAAATAAAATLASCSLIGCSHWLLSLAALTGCSHWLLLCEAGGMRLVMRGWSWVAGHVWCEAGGVRLVV